MQLFELRDANASFSRAYAYGDVSALPRMLRTEGWSAEWRLSLQYALHKYKKTNKLVTNLKTHTVIDTHTK